ncbi:MAG: ABC transporter permease [Chloroflexota bacterium]|nr:ABC transporter permease [Chloroflexota bacterium]
MSGIFPNAWYIARREYLVRVRSRAFVIMTAILALVGLGLALAPVGFRMLGADRPQRLGIIISAADPPPRTLALLGGSLNPPSASGQADGGTPRSANYELVPVTDPITARRDVQDGRLNGLLTIRRSSSGDLAFDYFGDSSPTSRSLAAVLAASQQLAISDRLTRAGVRDPSAIFTPVGFRVEPLDPNAGRRDTAASVAAYLLATVLVVLTFMAIMTYGNWVAGSVAEEKSSRVMELLITAASPRQLLAGKVIGTCAAGLTQYLAILGAALVGVILSGPLSRAIVGGSGASSPFAGITIPVLIVFGFFFLGGFVLYAAVYAALGSMVSRQEDVAQMVGPMTLVGVVGYFAAFTALSTPDSGWVHVLSFVPFFAPYFMPLRLVLSTVTPLEVVLSALLLVAGIVVVHSLAARIYSAGVLLYGQRPGIRAVWRAARVRR